MIFDTVLIWGSYALISVFSTVCLATGLYTIAEFAEEHTVLTKKVLRYSLIASFVLQICLWLFEDYPFFYILLSVVAQAAWGTLIKQFPFIELTNPKFLAALVLSLVTHVVWFRFFSYNYQPFNHVVAFFIVCVWMIPFAFFVSLSANDNSLPGNGPLMGFSGGDGGAWGSDGLGGKPRHVRTVNRLLALFNFLRRKKAEILPSSVSVKAL